MSEVSFETSGETSALATHSTQALATLLEQVAKEGPDGATRFKYEIKVTYDKPEVIEEAPIEPTEEEDVRVEKNKRDTSRRSKSTRGELREGGEEESSK